MDLRPEHRHERRTRRWASEDLHVAVMWAAGIAAAATAAERGLAGDGLVLVVALVAVALGALVLGLGPWPRRAIARARERDRAEQPWAAQVAGAAEPDGFGLVPGEDGATVATWRPGRLALHVLGVGVAATYALLPPPPGQPGRPTVAILLGALALWRARRYLVRPLVLRAEGLRQPLTGARLAWRDVVRVDERVYSGGRGAITYVEVEGRPGAVRRRLWGGLRRVVRVAPGQLEVGADDLRRALRRRARDAGAELEPDPEELARRTRELRDRLLREGPPSAGGASAPLSDRGRAPGPSTRWSATPRAR